MSTLDVVQDWMTRIGPLLDLERVTALGEGQGWELAGDDEVIVACVFDEGVGRLVLCSAAATLREDHRAAMHEALLRWNAAWRQHGGVRAALESARGPVLLLLDVPTNRLDLTDLCAVLSRFMNQVRAWREALTVSAPAAPDPRGTPFFMTRA